MAGNNNIKHYSLEGEGLIFLKKLIKKAIRINNRKIEAFGKKAPYHLTFKNAYIFPALINLHDHFRGNYLPKVGPASNIFYIRCRDWEKDLRSSPVIANERSKISELDCYYLSAYKNIFSGVATANDHYPHKINDNYLPLLPLRVIKEYTLHHEATSYALPWGDGIEIEHQRAVEKNYPFILHLEEGLDAEYQRGLDLLEELECLDRHNIHIHCIGYSDEDIRKTKQAGATVGWCPASNMFMYNVTCKIRKILKAGINVALGTDSCATGSINLLEEMRFARKVYRKMYGEDLNPHLIFEMVTVNPAKAFRMSKKIGSLEEGKLADVLVIKIKDSDPFESLLKTQIEDILLLTIEGMPVFGLKAYEELFVGRGQQYTEISLRGKKYLVKGDPKALLLRIREAVGHKKVLDFLPIDV